MGEPHSALRFHGEHLLRSATFGEHQFGAMAEAFARFFGTPAYLVAQTVVVAAWVALNALHVVGFDPFPFILLNLVFSLQAAYAAPLILLAQTRQAERDKAATVADALHREDLAQRSITEQALLLEATRRLHELVEANTTLTRDTQELSRRIEALTSEIHLRVVAPEPPRRA